MEWFHSIPPHPKKEHTLSEYVELHPDSDRRWASQSYLVTVEYVFLCTVTEAGKHPKFRYPTCILLPPMCACWPEPQIRWRTLWVYTSGSSRIPTLASPALRRISSASSGSSVTRQNLCGSRKGRQQQGEAGQGLVLACARGSPRMVADAERVKKTC
jgi:hypothetical protein